MQLKAITGHSSKALCRVTSNQSQAWMGPAVWMGILRSGTMFYDTAQYAPPRGDYQVYEDVHGSQWYAVHGEAAVERKPIYENGKPVYDGDNVRTVSTETVRYKSTPSRYGEPKSRGDSGIKPPRRRR